MKNFFKLSMVFALLALVFVGCNNDDDNNDVVDVSKDGTYIAGVAVGSIDVKFDQAKVEGASFSSYERNGMHEIYFYCVTGALEFKVIEKGAETVYGTKTVVDKVLDGTDADQMIGSYKTGELEAGGTTFNIETEGFYHILFDETSMNFWVIPVTKWEWVYNDIEFELGAASAQSVVWTKTGVKFPTHQSKLRYNDGWKIVTEVPILPEHDDLTDGDYVIIFTNLGFNDDNALEPGAGNGDVEKGMYDITLTWTPAQKFVIDLHKTGDVENTDYSGYLLGLIGNGVLVSDTAWGWGNLSFENKTPTKDGEIYTWNWTNVKIAANGDQENSWKFRKDNAWDFTLGFNDVTMSGSAGSDFFAGSGDGNFGVTEEGVYDFVLSVNADDDKWTLGAAVAGGATYDMWGLIGSATPNGWDDPDTDMTPNADGTEWTWTGDLVEGEYKFRSNDSWDNQIGDDGAGGAEFNTNATSWNIAAADAGNYTIVLDSETPALTITKN